MRRYAKLTKDYIFDADAKTISHNDEVIHVFKRDNDPYNLLCYFCENPGVVISKNTICQEVYGDDEYDGDQRPKRLVNKLRKYIPKSLIEWRSDGYIYLGEGFKEAEIEAAKSSPKTKASMRDTDDILSTPITELDTPEYSKRIDDAKLWLSKDYIKKDHQFYFENLSEMFQKRKSTFYDNRHNLEDFFVLPTLSRDSDVENIHIKLTDSDLTVSKIIENSVDNCVIITGSVGSGKTALMSYLLMELINNHEKYREYLPIAYPISEFDFSKDFYENIYTWLYKCGVGRDDEAEEIPYTEKCVYFIDNVDRLSHEESEVFIRSINAFVRDVGKESVFILFSRPFSDFEEYERFEIFRIEPLNEEKANSLISKLLKSHQERIDESKTVISSLPAFCKTNPYVLSILLRLTIEKRLPATYAERIDVIINSLIDGPDKNELDLFSGVSRDYFLKFIQGVCEYLALSSNGSVSNATLRNAIEFANTERRPTKRLLKRISFDEFTFDMTRRTGLMINTAGEYSFIDKAIVLWGCARSALQQKSLYDLFYKEYPGKLDKVPEVFDYIDQFNHDKVIFDLFYSVLYDTFGSRCDKPYEKYIQAFHDPLFYYVGEYPHTELLNGASDIVKRAIVKEAGCSHDLGNVLFPVYSDTDSIDYYLIDDEEAFRMGIPRIACREDISNEYFSNHPELVVVGKKYSLSFSDLVLCSKLREGLNKQQTEQYNYVTNQSLPMYREFMAVMDLYESLLNSP